MTDLSVVIVSYRNPELTRACLTSVFAEVDAPSFEVIVVDNDSGDGTPEMIEREFPAARLIRAGTNVGFARANNLAVRAARGDYVLLLNPDTVVLDRAPERLLAFARERGLGVYGGRTLTPGGELDPRSCWGRQTLWSTFCFATGLATVFRGHRFLDPESLGGWPRDSVRNVGTVTGCLVLVPRALWERLGGFDERFFMYGEDVDLCERARALACPVTVTPAATIVHVVGASSTSGAKMGMIMKGRATVMRKHWAPPARLAGLGLLAVGAGLRAAAARSGMWAEVWRRRADWLCGYPPVLPAATGWDVSASSSSARWSQLLARAKRRRRATSSASPEPSARSTASGKSSGVT